MLQWIRSHIVQYGRHITAQLRRTKTQIIIIINNHHHHTSSCKPPLPPLSTDAGRLTALVASHTCVAHVYDGGTLRWAARLPFSPVSAGRLRLRQLAGLLALLSPSGQLVVAYLGTTPSLFVAPPVQTAGALDYEALDEELAGLNVVIQRSQKQDGKERGGGRGRGRGRMEEAIPDVGGPVF